MSFQKLNTLRPVILGAAVLSLSASLMAQPTTWIVNSMQRVGRTDGVSGSPQAIVSSARNEYESFQIIVRAPGGPLTNVNVSVSDLAGAGGQIAAANLALFREQYVYVNASSPNWGGSNQPLGAGWYPDALVPFLDPATGAPPAGGYIKAVPFNLGPGTNQPIWVDVFVPPATPAGQYTGSYTITSDQGSASGSITVNVWNFTLPSRPSLKSAFLVWSAGLGAEEELLRNKLAPSSTNPSDQPMLMSRYGLGTAHVGMWSGADVSHCSMSPAPSVQQFQQAAARQQPGLYLYDYSADEIDNCPSLFPTLKDWGRNMHQAGIANLVTMSPRADLFDDGSGSGRSAVDIWVVLPEMYDADTGMIQQALAKGDCIWSYNALVQDAYSPKWLIDFAPVNFRLQPGFLNQSLGISGLLYWRVDDWAGDPWNNVNNAGVFSSGNYPGEGMLMYPGGPVGLQGAAPSMRLKWLRDGVDDYEYVQMLKSAGQGGMALQIARTAGADWSNWTRDFAAIETARQQLGNQLSLLGGGVAPAPPPTPVVAPPPAPAPSVPLPPELPAPNVISDPVPPGPIDPYTGFGGSSGGAYTTGFGHP